jgi:hypothetical protein
VRSLVLATAKGARANRPRSSPDAIFKGKNHVEPLLLARGGGIHIKPSHRGLLTKEVGKAGLSAGNLRKEIAHDKASGNTAREKREVFALNAKTKFHH